MDVRVSKALKRPLIVAMLLFISVVTLLPFVWLLSASVKSQADFFSYMFLPTSPDGFLGVDWERITFSHFNRAIFEKGYGTNFMNTVFFAAANSLFTVLACSLTGYALAKLKFKGRGVCMAIVLSSMLIPGTLLLAPVYQLLYQLNLLGSYFGLIIPGLVPAFGVILFRQAMINTVPDSLLEAARMDGAGELRIFFSVVLPVVRPMVGAYAMLTFVAAWNSFIMPQVILQESEDFPLAVAIANLQDQYSADYGLIAAATLISIAPIMIFMLIMQKEFISGLTSGAVKE